MGSPQGSATVRLRMLAPGLTRAARRSVVGADEPLAGPEREQAGAARTALGQAWLARAAAVTAPHEQCRETAELLGLAAEPVEALRDWDLGAWAGQSTDTLGRQVPEDVRRWLADPSYAGHGGESLLDLVGRVAAWLASTQEASTQEGSAWVTAVAPAAVVRAAVVAHLDLPVPTFWRLDIEPWAGPELTLGVGGSRLRWSGRRETPRGGATGADLLDR